MAPSTTSDGSIETGKGRGRLARLAWPVALVLLTGALYGRTVGFGFVVFDDHSKIVDNPLVTRPAPLADRLLTPSQGYIIPVTVGYWTASYRLGGGRPWAFHLGNVLLHTLVVLLLYGLVRRLLPGSRLVAGAAGLLLLAHPITVEPVAWATGAKDLLAALFALAATALFVTRVATPRDGAPGDAPSAWQRWIGPAAFGVALLAMLSKPTTTLIGAAWLGYLAARRLAARPAPRAAWVVAGATLVGGIALGALGRFAHDLLLVAAPEPFVFGDLRVPLALGHQVHHLLWPATLHPMYLVDKTAGLSDWHTAVGLAVLAGFAATCWLARRSPAALLGLGLAGAAYLPVSNLLPFPRIVADSYLYLPLCGLLLAASAGLVRAPARWRRPVAVGALLLAGALALVGQRQLERWRGGERLWGPLIAAYPGWERPYGALATAELRAGRPAEAARRFGQAFFRGYRAEWLADFGVALAQSGQLGPAECVMLEAIHHGPAPRRGLHNYALLLGHHPRRRPRYPTRAAALLPLIAAEVHAGRLRAGPRLRRALAAHRSALGAPPRHEPRWPRGSCGALRRRGGR